MTFEKFIELYQHNIAYKWSSRIEEHVYIENDVYMCSIIIVVGGSEGGSCWGGETESFSTLLHIGDTILYSTCVEFFKISPSNPINDTAITVYTDRQVYHDYYGNYEINDKFIINLNLLYKNMILEKLKAS